MAGSERGSDRRRRRGPIISANAAAPPGRPAMVWLFLAAIGLELFVVPVLLFNEQHSGDRLKIRRELRKF